MYFIGGDPGRSVDGVVVGGLDVLHQRVLVVLVLVDIHGQHHGHGVVDALNAGTVARVIRAGVDLVDTNAFVEGVGELGRKLNPVVGHPQRGMHWSTRMSAVLAAVNWTAVTGHTSAQRLKRSVKKRA